MAQKVQVLLVDDLDGGDAEETVKFGLDGTNYEIDLSGDNARALRDTLAKYVGVARKTGRAAAARGAAAPRNRGGSSAASDREQNRAIREWAKRQGLEISDRGRISADIVERYHAEAGR
ncbi:histone-like nucleoid-structuring protein Lsr2 [Actinocatenispora rupis]|uniref:histone-like nucleoid-structuring protein Lsr2 n=1 Tax=Actinocatenispora rupis TaxID=519421 RepID=UPI001940E16F|nr:Lsr2 family protein [Actinocatenispora rupis]